MPRGVRRQTDYTAELREIDAKIQRHQEQIAALEDRREQISELMQKAELQKLKDFLDSSGLSVSDVIHKLGPRFQESV